jgi:hypothetical protein
MAVIGVADDTGNQRRFELDHHVPGHHHHVGAAFAGSRQQNHWTRFEQLVDLCERQIFHRGAASDAKLIFMAIRIDAKAAEWQSAKINSLVSDSKIICAGGG